MDRTLLKKQFDTYIPLLAPNQQMVVLEMIKGLIGIENETVRITKQQYNEELDAAVKRIESGQFKSHEEALMALSKW
jgi:hypothetical protein